MTAAYGLVKRQPTTLRIAGESAADDQAVRTPAAPQDEQPAAQEVLSRGAGEDVSDWTVVGAEAPRGGQSLGIRVALGEFGAHQQGGVGVAVLRLHAPGRRQRVLQPL